MQSNRAVEDDFESFDLKGSFHFQHNIESIQMLIIDIANERKCSNKVCFLNMYLHMYLLFASVYLYMCVEECLTFRLLFRSNFIECVYLSYPVVVTWQLFCEGEVRSYRKLSFV